MFNVEIKESMRAKNINLRILNNHTIQLVIPKNLRNKEVIINKILKERKDFIKKHLQKFEKKEKLKKYLPDKLEVNGKTIQGNKLKIWAKEKIIKNTRDLAQKLNFDFNFIYIRNQKTRWGSCSSRKNLSFNYKIALLPDELFEYIILHELMHLKHPHHQKDFWADLNFICADVKEKRKQLHQYSTR
ncbi:MAG: M48 family metallopeptidase [Patescibacteria group bacterium]|nr:M48 family metallopeptidase [Patescibacteria group bacterium]